MSTPSPTHSTTSRSTSPTLTNFPTHINEYTPGSSAAAPDHDASVPMKGQSSTSSLGNSLLREYALQLGSLNHEGLARHNDLDDNDNDHFKRETSFSAASTVADHSATELSPPVTAVFKRNLPIHRKNVLSVDSVPRQTIMKALASRRNGPGLSIAPSLSTTLASAASDKETCPATSSSQSLSTALSDLALTTARNLSPGPARFPSLQSPCFYHERFDDAVDIDRVLEEIQDDAGMSHSRLLQTAKSVREVSKQLQRRSIKRAVRNVMIVTKARDNQLVNLTRELAYWLISTPRYGSDIGVNVFVDAKLRNSKRFGAAQMVEEEPRFQHLLKFWSPDLCWSQPEKFDLVLTLGGDGTVLFTSWLFQRVVPPILSFSLGSLGFLTNFEFNRYKEHLDKVMGEDGMRVNMRMRFTCTVYRGGAAGQEMLEGEQFEVLNELVIDRGPSPYVSNLELYGDNELLTVVQADGCIFSTPTGKVLC